MSTINHSGPTPTPEEIWHLFRETGRRFQELEHLMKESARESDRRLQELERFIKESRQETERMSQETQRMSQETERMSQETQRMSQETERKFQETERLMDKLSLETDKKIGKLGNRLGEFVEEMIAPGVVELFQARDIEVHGLSRDINRRNPKLNLATQIDLFAVNGDSCILIEVKSKLSIDDINEHLERMDKFKPLFPEYADKKVYGAVAAMVMPDEVAKYAYRKGFFVLAQQGEIVKILNDEKFKPVVW